MGLIALLVGAVFSSLSNDRLMDFLMRTTDPLGILPLWGWFYIFGGIYLLYAIFKVPSLIFGTRLLDVISRITLMVGYSLAAFLVLGTILRSAIWQFGALPVSLVLILVYAIWYRSNHPDEWKHIWCVSTRPEEWKRMGGMVYRLIKRRWGPIYRSIKEWWDWFQEMRRRGY